MNSVPQANHLCSNLRSHDAFAQRGCLLFMCLVFIVPVVVQPELLRVPFWVPLAIGGLFFTLAFCNQHLYHCADSKTAYVKTELCGIPVWPRKSIDLQQVSRLTLTTETDSEQWANYYVKLEWVQPEKKPIVIMQRRDPVQPVIEEARRISKALGVQFVDQRKRKTK